MRRSWCEPSAKPCSTSSAGARPPARADRESARSVRHRRGLAEQRVIREIMLFLHSNGVGTPRAATSLERREVPMQLNPLSSWHWLPSGHGPKASVHRNLTKADLRQRQCLPNGPGEKSATPGHVLGGRLVPKAVMSSATSRFNLGGSHVEGYRQPGYETTLKWNISRRQPGPSSYDSEKLLIWTVNSAHHFLSGEREAAPPRFFAVALL